MSLRDKAKEIKAAGEAERGNFTPTGVPKRAYEWWLAESSSKRAEAIKYGGRKENFCHFWRVVLFWAPLRKVAYAFDKYVINGYVAGAILTIFLLGLLTIAILNPLNALFVVGFITFCVLQAFGAMAGASAAVTPDRRRKAELFENKKAITVFFILGFVLSIPVFLIVKAVQGYRAHLTEYNAPITLTLVGVAITIGLAIVGLSGGLPALLTLLAAAVVLGAGFFFLRWMVSMLGPLIQARRAAAEARNEDALAVYIAEHGEVPPHVPGRAEKFFTGLGDFIVLIAQVIRTKKWKICPMVEIDS